MFSVEYTLMQHTSMSTTAQEYSCLLYTSYFIIFAIEKIDRYALVDFFYPLEGALSCLYINCQPCADRQNRHN